jgi:hypothetical protein
MRQIEQQKKIKKTYAKEQQQRNRGTVEAELTAAGGAEEQKTSR